MSTNAGLGGLPIGLDCTRCGKSITVDYIAHGSSREALVSDAMQDLVKAAARAAMKDKPQLCAECSNS